MLQLNITSWIIIEIIVIVNFLIILNHFINLKKSNKKMTQDHEVSEIISKDFNDNISTIKLRKNLYELESHLDRIEFNLEKKQSKLKDIGIGVKTVRSDTKKAQSQLKKIENNLDTLLAENMNKEKELKMSYFNFIRKLILLIDHLESSSGTKKQKKYINRSIEKIIYILKEEGVEKIKVKKGNLFNSKYHEIENTQKNKSQKGTILKIIRNGYFIKENNEEYILRPTEVSISDGSKKAKKSLGGR